MITSYVLSSVDERICHIWSRGRLISPSLPVGDDWYLNLNSQKRPPGRNLGEHRSVRRSGTASRATALLVFGLRMRSILRTVVLTTFFGKKCPCRVHWIPHTQLSSIYAPQIKPSSCAYVSSLDNTVPYSFKSCFVNQFLFLSFTMFSWIRKAALLQNVDKYKPVIAQCNTLICLITNWFYLRVSRQPGV